MIELRTPFVNIDLESGKRIALIDMTQSKIASHVFDHNQNNHQNIISVTFLPLLSEKRWEKMKIDKHDCVSMDTGMFW